MPDPIRRTDVFVNVDDLNALPPFPSDGADSGAFPSAALPVATTVTGFYRSDTTATASAAEGEVAARTVSLTEAGKARAGENLSPIEAHREVYVNPAGHFVTRAGASGAPASVAELGEGLYRAASIIDDTKANLFRSLPSDLRTRMVGNVAAAAARAPAGGPPPAGLDEMQAKQLRSSAATVLLELMDSLDAAGAQASAKQQAYQQYAALLRAETDKVLRQSMATNLDLKSGGLSPAQRAEAKALLEGAVPTRPPYDAWFAGGNDTVRVAWSIGPEFLEGNRKLLEARGFTKTSESPLVYAKEIEKSGARTRFELTLRYNREDTFAEMGDPRTHMVAYDGHSNWGRNVRESLRGAPDMQGAKVALIGMCAGKGELNMIEDKYPDGQTITTWNSSYFWTDPSTGHQTRSENFEALMATIDGIAARSDWTAIAEDTRRRAMLASSHTVDNNYIFPTDKEIRRRVLDRDFDGQADHFDRFVDFSTFDVVPDLANDFMPKDASRMAGKIVGTRVHIAAMGINRSSYYNEALHDANPRGTVVDDGFYQPKPGDREIIRFHKDVQGGTPVTRMRVNASFAHMSEESLRALAMYEFNRHLAKEQGSRWPYRDEVDSKLHGLILISHSLDTDTGYRDREVWDQALRGLGFPPIDKALVDRIRDSDHHWYSGARAGVAELKRSLPRDVLARLADPDVGRPDAAGVR